MTSVDWSKRTVAVEPTDDKGKSRWLGFEVCQAMKRVLLREGDAELRLSKRGTLQLDEIRVLIAAPEQRGSLLLEHLPSGRLRWWTFAGGAVNSALAIRLGDIGSTRVDDLWVETGPGVSVPSLMRAEVDSAVVTAVAENLAERSALKFAACLRREELVAVVASRSLDETNLLCLARGDLDLPPNQSAI